MARNNEVKIGPQDNAWAKWSAKSSQTQGKKKVWNYFVEVTKTELFKRKIKDLRKKYGVPEAGFPVTVGITYPPRAYGFAENNQKLSDDIKQMCEDYGLHFVYWTGVIEGILFYNILEPINDDGYDVCGIADLKNEYGEPFSKDIQEADLALYPLAIRISPHATQRDIMDYVKRNAFLIRHMQKKYQQNIKGLRVGKVKRKKESIQKRNDFIYQNKDISRKKLAGLVAEKFGEYLDYAYIGKIIWLENRKRKDV